MKEFKGKLTKDITIRIKNKSVIIIDHTNNHKNGITAILKDSDVMDIIINGSITNLKLNNKESDE